MKKLIAVLAMVALISGVAFAQVGGAVFGGVRLLESGVNGEGKDSINGSGGMHRVRLAGSGASDDGTFGGFVRLDAETGDYGKFNSAYAWWKPIEQFKLILGGDADSFWGKDGYSRWMFYQVAGDVGIANAGNAWGGGYGSNNFGDAFWGGIGTFGAFMEIKPIDILGINIGLPYMDKSGSEVADIFEAAKLQLNVNLDFGNIAITMDGLSDAGKLFVYFGLGAVENLDLAIGFSFDLGSEVPAIAAALKYGISDSFALKFRAGATLADKNTQILADVMPIIGINDSMTAFVSAGIAMTNDAKDMEFHFNPYIQVGSEWGPSFWAGFRLWSTGNMKDMHWAVPIAINYAF